MRTNKITRRPACGRSLYGWRAALLSGVLFFGASLAGCLQDDDSGLGATGGEITFTASVNGTALPDASAIAPRTRTTNGGDSWKVGDQVGIFMLPTGGNISKSYADAQNKTYNVSNTSTGALAPDGGSNMHYPRTDNVDFIAYYPHGSPGNNPGEISPDYTYSINITGQTDEAAQNAIDVLYVKKTNVANGTAPIALAFDHVMSKITLNVTPGKGFAPTDISELTAANVKFDGMPVTATLTLQDGTLTAGADLTQTFSPLKAATPATGANATFTAIIVPQTDMTGRKLVFTIAGADFTWNVPDNEIFVPGKHYIYPVTVNKSGIEVGSSDITDWRTHDNGSGTVTPLEVAKIPAATS